MRKNIAAKIIALILLLALIIPEAPAKKVAAATKYNVAGETYEACSFRVTGSTESQLATFQVSKGGMEIYYKRTNSTTNNFDKSCGTETRNSRDYETYNTWISALPQLSSTVTKCQNTITINATDYLVIGQTSALSADAPKHYSTLAIEIGRKKRIDETNYLTTDNTGDTSTYRSSSSGFDSVIFQTPIGKNLQNLTGSRGVGQCLCIEFSEGMYLYSYWLVSVSDFIETVRDACAATGTIADSNSWYSEITSAQKENPDNADKMYFKMNKIISTHTDKSSYKLIPSAEDEASDGSTGYIQKLSGVTFVKTGNDTWQTKLSYSGASSGGYSGTAIASLRSQSMPDDDKLGKGAVNFTYSDFTVREINKSWHQDVFIYLQMRAFFIQYYDGATGKFVGDLTKVTQDKNSEAYAQNGAQLTLTYVDGKWNTFLCVIPETKFQIKGLNYELDESPEALARATATATGRGSYDDWRSKHDSLPPVVPPASVPAGLVGWSEHLQHTAGQKPWFTDGKGNIIKCLASPELYKCFVIFVPVKEGDNTQIYVKYFDVDSGKYLKDISDYWTDSSTVENSISLCI